MVSEDIRSSDISRITEVEDAVRVLTGALDPVIGNDVVSLKDATGRILAEDIVAGMSVPSFPKSAMDGYAVRSSDISDASEDTPVRLKVIGCITAGDKIPADIRDRMDFVLKVISEHKASPMYKDALDAENYYTRKNTTITEYQKLLYTISGDAVPDNYSANYKLCSGFFQRFVIQQVQMIIHLRMIMMILV